MISRILSRLQPATLEKVGAFLGSVWFYVVRVRRAQITQNLGIAFPALDSVTLRKRTHRVMQILTSHFLETATLLCLTDDQIDAKIEWEGLDHIHAAMADGGGVLILATHIDNWELLIQGFGTAGLELNAAVRMPTSEGVNKGLIQIRRRANFKGHEPKGSIRTLVGVLAENRPVTVVMDQAQSRRRGIFVHFFGRPAMTTPGLAVLALKSRRPVIPVIPHRIAPGKIRLQAGPPIPYDDLLADPDAFVSRATARFTAVVEANIRKQPERWLWAHRRFKVQTEEGDEIADPVELDVAEDGSIVLAAADTAPVESRHKGSTSVIG